jgi:hypothetical protein
VCNQITTDSFIWLFAAPKQPEDFVSSGLIVTQGAAFDQIVRANGTGHVMIYLKAIEGEVRSSQWRRPNMSNMGHEQCDWLARSMNDSIQSFLR